MYLKLQQNIEEVELIYNYIYPFTVLVVLKIPINGFKKRDTITLIDTTNRYSYNYFVLKAKSVSRILFKFRIKVDFALWNWP